MRYRGSCGEELDDDDEEEEGEKIQEIEEKQNKKIRQRGERITHSRGTTQVKYYT